jgi:hypothetical protein
MHPTISDAKPSNAEPPQHWTRTISGEGGDELIYAVRNGSGHLFLVALGMACLLGGAWTIYWLATESELTVAGYIFILLVPGGAMLFGVYSLNIALWLRHGYILGQYAFSARSYSLFGDKRQEISRQSIQGIRQSYSPPEESEATGAPGHWVTFVSYIRADNGKPDDFAVDGMRTKAEAQWLGPILSHWANVPLQRGFGAAFEDADPTELPDL